MAVIPCPKCKNKVTHWDQTEGKMHCPICGQFFQLPVGVIKSVVVKINNPEPLRSAGEAPNVPDKLEEEREYMKNKLGDLNNHLFEQLERLNTTDLKGDELREEIERSKAVTSVAHEIILNGKLTLDAIIAIKEKGINNILPAMLTMEEKK